MFRIRPDFLDVHSRTDSPVHRLPAVLKLTGALGMILTIVLTGWHGGVVLAGAAVVLLAAAWMGRVPGGFLLRRLLLLEPFVLGVAVLALFQAGGWQAFGLLVVKSTLCLLTMILLAGTTPFAELLRVLRGARVPSLLVTTLALMYRYLFVLVEESDRMTRARASRSFTAGRSHAWQNLAGVISHLFIRASERAERIYWAMCARGWR